MRSFKITILAILLLLIVVAVAWFALYYVIWPKPDLLILVPDKPYAYIAASNLEKTVAVSSVSEFLNRFFNSPTWEGFKTTASGKKLVAQKDIWEKKLGRPVDTNAVMQIVGKNASIAFYKDQGTWNFLLTSQLSMFMRFGMALGIAKHSLGAGYGLVEEKYKGINLTTIESIENKAPQPVDQTSSQPPVGQASLLVTSGNEKYSYAFIGRAGMLSSDISLLKKAIDAYKDKTQGLAENPDYTKLTAGLSGTDLSFYIDTSRIDEIYTPPNNPASSIIKKKPSKTKYLLSLANQFDGLASFCSQEFGNLRFDSRFQNGNVETKKPDPGNTSLFTPEDCIFFLHYKDMKPETVFEMTKGLLNLDLDVVKYLLLPSLGNGVSLTALEPNIQELQLVPPIITVFTIKNKDALGSALTIINKSLMYGKSKLEFSPIEHEGLTAFHTSLTTRRGLYLEPGYAVIGDSLIIASYKSALKTAIDVYKGKQQPIAKDKDYSYVLESIGPATPASIDGNIFVDIRSLSKITKQGAKMYGIQAKLMGKKSAELSAAKMYQNADLWEVWHYMGAIFNSEDGKTNVKLVLNSE